MLNFVPPPLGRDTAGLCPSPMTKTLESRVAKVRSRMSLTCTWVERSGKRGQLNHSHAWRGRVEQEGEGRGSGEKRKGTHDVEATEVSLLVDDDTGSAHVSAT
jgi:hypothetical protein